MDWVIAMIDANDRLELPMKGPLLDRSSWKARPSLPAELDPVLDRVKTLARGGLTSMMVLGDLLRHRIAPLQQLSKMACMFTRVNNCSRIVHGVGSDLSGAEQEVLIRVMTGEAYAPELLVLPRGIKALCDDQAMQTVVLASLPTLDEGGLAVRQVRGDPNRGVRILDTLPDSHQRADPSPDGSNRGGPAPSGKEKVPEAATSRSSRDSEEDRSRRLRRGDGSFVGQPAPKRQKITELGGRVTPGLRRHRCITSSRTGGQRRRGGHRDSSDHCHHLRLRPSDGSRPHRRHHHRSSSRPHLYHQRRLRRRSPAGRPGHHPQEGGNPKSSKQDGGCGAPREWLTPNVFLIHSFFGSLS
jgi:hypothetical protein